MSEALVCTLSFCFISLSLTGPHPAPLGNVHSGHGILRIWEQQSHPTTATRGCESTPANIKNHMDYLDTPQKI